MRHRRRSSTPTADSIAVSCRRTSDRGSSRSHATSVLSRTDAARRRAVEVAQDPHALEEIVAAPAPSNELDGLTDALATLTEQQRHAIILREWHGLSYSEIAERLELSQAAVETLLFRARRSLARRSPPAARNRLLPAVAPVARGRRRGQGRNRRAAVAVTATTATGAVTITHSPRPRRRRCKPASCRARRPSGRLRPRRRKHRAQSRGGEASRRRGCARCVRAGDDASQRGPATTSGPAAPAAPPAKRLPKIPSCRLPLRLNRPLTARGNGHRERDHRYDRRPLLRSSTR